MQRNKYLATLFGLLALLLIALFPASADASDPGFWHPTDAQWAGSLVLQFPGVGDFDVYSRGLGIEAQYRQWYGLTGFALSLGAERWATEKTSSNWGTDQPSLLDGDLTLVPVGVSAIGRWPLREGLVLRGEAGLRYVWTDSEIKIRMPGFTSSQPVDIKDGWLVLAGIGVEQLLTETLMFFGGLRYQHDLVRADARTQGYSLMDNHLRSFTLQAGLQVWY